MADVLVGTENMTKILEPYNGKSDFHPLTLLLLRLLSFNAQIFFKNMKII